MPAARPEDDVKVAGGPFAGGPAEGPAQGGTASFPAFPAGSPQPGAMDQMGPAGPDGPAEAHDEISSGSPSGPSRPARAGRSRRSGGGSRSRAPRRAGGGGSATPGGSGRSGGATRRTGVKVAVVVTGAAVVVGGGAVAAFAFTGDSGGKDGGKTTVQSAPLADAAVAAPPVDPKVMETERRKKALDRASRAARKGTSTKKPVLRPKGTPIPTKKPEDKPTPGTGGGGGAPVSDPVPAGEAQQIAKGMLPSFGFGGEGEFGCLVKLWNKESGWRSNAANPSSGAYGIPQALPGSKMASAGSDWRTSARTQIKWGLGYIKDRYGTPCKAWSHSESVGWY
ncbi:lytic transglycosylase domain-containing protein [Spirillospora sp. NBC_01491]|uniref:aggregation-promoting factor C-terminal-like domain-containing protein n=1 Tax=Spirillospora sp. NBC_01491 TaxID=2976007 RepID=UPI002E343D2A|nr:lytic transglycosylase domain-containing protein [Spirillospora sp. NBC_01491]